MYLDLTYRRAGNFRGGLFFGLFYDLWESRILSWGFTHYEKYFASFFWAWICNAQKYYQTLAKYYLKLEDLLPKVHEIIKNSTNCNKEYEN